jgi:hypothetical protein
VQLSFNRLWNSPTITTWASLAVRLVSVGAVLPLVLSRFDTAEIAVWLLFGVVLNLQILGDLGFAQSYTRAVAYVFGGATLGQIAFAGPVSSATTRNNVDPIVLGTLLGTMNRLFHLAAWSFFALLLFVGNLVIERHLSELADPDAGKVAWLVVAAATAVSLRSNYYTCYLIGAGEVALVKRWEAAFGLASVLSIVAILVLKTDCTLLQFVLLQQVWVLVALIRNWWLFAGHVSSMNVLVRRFDKQVFRDLWPGAWRGGLGIAMSAGLIQASGLVYAWLAPASQAASYLLALRLIQAVSQISQAPFYSKLPLLTRLRAQGQLDQQLQLARRGMRISHLTYAAGFLSLGFTAWWLLKTIHSGAQFVEPWIWAMMGIAFFLERLGAMHLQLYSTTGHIIWHIANGWTGVMMLGMSVLSYRFLGLIAFPLAMALSYASVYCPISLRHSSRMFGFKPAEYERNVAGLPASLILLYSVGAFAWRAV